jgi:hypothetical protein
MRILELFKGTGSVSKYIEKYHPDCEIISLDIFKKFNPTICKDIIDWNYKEYPCGYFDIIWASPECKIYSILQGNLLKNKWGDENTWRHNLEVARRSNDKYVLRVLEIIEYFKPEKWFIENPYYSNMKEIPEMKKLNSYRFDYCRFGFDYQKPTRIWSNVKLESKKCICKGPHKIRVCICNKLKLNKGQKPDPTDMNKRYSIPENLIKELFISPIV